MYCMLHGRGLCNKSLGGKATLMNGLNERHLIRCGGMA